MIDRLKSVAANVKRELKVYQLVLKDQRTPRLARWLLMVAVGYALCPIDIIPDFVPVLGYLDDAILIPGLIGIALKMIPHEVVEDCRAKAVQLTFSEGGGKTDTSTS